MDFAIAPIARSRVSKDILLLLQAFVYSVNCFKNALARESIEKETYSFS